MSLLMALLLLSFVACTEQNGVLATGESPADSMRVLAFLREVVGLDVDTYEVSLRTQAVRNYSDVSIMGDIGYVETSGSYTMQYWNTTDNSYSLLHSNFKFADETLVLCSLAVDSGKPLFCEPLPADPAAAASTFIQRYHAFSNDDELSAMQNLLLNVDGTKNLTKTVDNLQVEVSVTSVTSFQWRHIYNNVEYPGLGVTFRDGMFYSFGDDRSIYTIGETAVNISEEQAKNIALNQAAFYSYSYDGRMIDNFSIVENQILTELRTKSRYTVNELYPFYSVYLPLSEQYPGHVSVIRVELWADTGEVISCQTLNYGGSVTNPDSSPTPPPTTKDPTATTPVSGQTQEKEDQPSNSYLIPAITAISIAALIVILTVIKKKRPSQLPTASRKRLAQKVLSYSTLASTRRKEAIKWVNCLEGQALEA